MRSIAPVPTNLLSSAKGDRGTSGTAAAGARRYPAAADTNYNIAQVDMARPPRRRRTVRHRWVRRESLERGVAILYSASLSVEYCL